ncbi:uncharacterized protein C8orf74 homolog [Kryptolebias marmoratus]|uniref:uncharacterized protein C8orf74 homolog n=1 Tax=Kryptolebias marmoratus TaxID=37003 RepID=UPI0007F941D1|nr:uncharacterized protein C8orf74 homolog [Kryptolebias marmoratus]
MDSLTESEITRIVRLEKDAGVQVLSCHFQWPEFSDERLRFHQEFVYDVAAFAAGRGFSWPNVIRSAVLAKVLFPQLDGFDVRKLSALLREALCERLPDLTPVQQRELARFLVDACVARARLFRAVAGGRVDASVSLTHLEVQLPPTPRPLAQGVDLLQWEAEREAASGLQRVEDVTLPEDGQPDEQEARRDAESQAPLAAATAPQRGAAASGGRQNATPTQTGRGKAQAARAKTGAKGKAK